MAEWKGERREEQGQEEEVAVCVLLLPSEPHRSALLVFGPLGQSHLLQEIGDSRGLTPYWALLSVAQGSGTAQGHAE